MINPSKLLPSNRSTSTASPEGVKITVKNVKVKSLQKGIVRDLITIDSYFKNRLKFTKKKVRIRRRDRLQQEFKTRENFLESTKKLIKGPARLVNKLIPNTVKSYWSTIKNFFLKIFLGFIAVRFFELLPKLSGFLKLLAGVGKFLIDFGGLLLGGLVSFITFGDRLVSGLRDQVGNIFGSKGVQLFDRLTNVLATVINLTTIAAGIAIFQAFRFRSLQDRLLDINRRRGGGGGAVGGSGSKVPKGPKGPFGTTGAVARVFQGLGLALDVLGLIALGKALVVTALTPIPGDEIIAGGLFAKTGIRVIRKLNQFRKALGFTNPLRDVDDAGNAINFFKRRKITVPQKLKVPVTTSGGVRSTVTFGKGTQKLIKDSTRVTNETNETIGLILETLRKSDPAMTGRNLQAVGITLRSFRKNLSKRLENAIRVGDPVKIQDIKNAMSTVDKRIIKIQRRTNIFENMLGKQRDIERTRLLEQIEILKLRKDQGDSIDDLIKVQEEIRNIDRDARVIKKILNRPSRPGSTLDTFKIKKTRTSSPTDRIEKDATTTAQGEAARRQVEVEALKDRANNAANIAFQKALAEGKTVGEAQDLADLAALREVNPKINKELFESLKVKSPLNKFFGGLVLGTPGVDKVPAMLTSGEFVLDLDSTNYLEGTMPGFLSDLNKAKPKDIAGVLRKYAFYEDPEPKERIVYVPIKQPSKSAPPQESRGGGVIVKNKNGGGKSSAASEILYRG